MGLLGDLSRVASEGGQAAVLIKVLINSSGPVHSAQATNLPFAHSPSSFVYCTQLYSIVGAGISKLRNRLSSTE